MLPGALAAQYYGRSGRKDFVEAVDRAAADGPAALRDALVRWGYGMSYHEFELAFDDLPAHTVASSYHPLLYPSRPVRGEELHLAATLDAWRLDLPPCWSRSWPDTILSAQPQADPPVHVRPWQMTLAHDVPGAAMLADGRIELRRGARLPVRLPVPTDELHVGRMASDPAHALRIDVATEVLAPIAVASLDGVPPWHAAAQLPEPTDTLELSLPAGGCVTYVGYRGAADPLASMGRAAGW